MGKLKLKITELCNANCLCCQQRLKKYSKDIVKMMPIELAKKCIDDVSVLNWNKLIFSGGEPTLHPHLFEMIRYSHEKHMVTSLYSNGGSITEGYIDELNTNGLDILMLSYYSFDEDVFCKIRQSNRLYRDATKAMDCLKILNNENRVFFKIRLQSVLTKYNYKSLPELLRYAIEAKFETLSISYLEHARTQPLLYMNTNDINIFQKMIIPEMKEIIMHTNNISNRDKDFNLRALDETFQDRYEGKPVDIYNGQYRDARCNCINKNEYIVVNPSGNVLPCCGMEYYDENIFFGNVKDDKIANIIDGDTFKDFWNREKEICKYCAVDRHFFLITS